MPRVQYPRLFPPHYIRKRVRYEPQINLEHTILANRSRTPPHEDGELHVVISYGDIRAFAFGDSNCQNVYSIVMMTIYTSDLKVLKLVWHTSLVEHKLVAVLLSCKYINA